MSDQLSSSPKIQPTLALSSGVPQWKPIKEKTNLQLLVLSLFAGMIIGVLSDSLLAFSLAGIVIGMIGGLFVWHKTDLAVVGLIALLHYTNLLKFQDPLVFLCFGILCAQVILYGRQPKSHPTAYFIFFYFCWTVLGIAFGTDLAENIDYLITFLSLMLYYIVIINFIQNKEYIRWIPVLCGITYSVLGIEYTYLFVTGQVGNFLAAGDVIEGHPDDSVVITPMIVFLFKLLGERNYMCMNLCFISGITLYSCWGHPKPWVRKLMLLCFVMMAAAIFFCGGRGGLLGFIIVCALIGFHERKRKEVWVAGAIFIIAGAILVPMVLGARFKENQGQEDYSKYVRKQLLRNGIKMARDNVFFGVGPRNYSWAFKKFYWKPSYYATAFKNLEAHNMYVELVAEGGIFILILFLGILFFTLYSFHSAEKKWRESDPGLSLIMRGGKLGFIGWMSCAFFLSATGERTLWVIVGFAVASFLIATEDTRQKEEGKKSKIKALL